MVSRYVTNGPVKQEGICLLPPTHFRMIPPRKFYCKMWLILKRKMSRRPPPPTTMEETLPAISFFVRVSLLSFCLQFKWNDPFDSRIVQMLHFFFQSILGNPFVALSLESIADIACDYFVGSYREKRCSNPETISASMFQSMWVCLCVCRCVIFVNGSLAHIIIHTYARP